jgi:HEPN domain-containing protein
VKTSESRPEDWLFLTQERLRAVDALYATEGVTLSGIELLQESVERYLKAFLIARGWSLRKVHDLAYLMDECIARDPAFSQFDDMAEQLTEQFWAQHYPGADLTGVGADYERLRTDASRVAAHVTAALERPDPGTPSDASEL